LNFKLGSRGGTSVFKKSYLLNDAEFKEDNQIHFKELIEIYKIMSYHVDDWS
jgi:hypothetical protein